MKFASPGRLIASLTLAVTFASCSSKHEDITVEPLTDYMPLAVGKYITYHVDSLVFVDFQRRPETHSYQVKHVIDAEVTDNLGRPSYRVYRWIRNEDGTGDWTANGTYFITPGSSQMELIEDNLRFVKLRSPLREGFSWKGNTYLPTDPYDPFGYNFSNDDDIKEWDYYYNSFEPTLEVNDQTYTDVYTVEQQDDLSNVPVDDPMSYGFKSRVVEKYSRTIGLVYRQYELWEYQPNLSGPDPYYTGFGITMYMIDHN